MKIVSRLIIQPVIFALVLGVLIFSALSIKPVLAVTAGNNSSEIQTAMIQKLLEQIQLLQKQLMEMQKGTSYTAQNNSCLVLNTNLGYRSADSFSNNEVSALQDFLQAKGYLNSAPTGFFGLMTAEALKSFQVNNGIEGTGYLGNETRAKIKNITCSKVDTPSPVACTMDVKMCSDGSSVGRVAPSCSFAACPSTVATQPKPKITLAEFSQGNEAGDTPAVAIWGSNLAYVVKLEYFATSEQPGTIGKDGYAGTIRGELNTGTIGKDGYASFKLDKYLGNAIITDLKVRVADNQGQTSAWKVIDVKQSEEEEPSMTKVSFKNETRSNYTNTTELVFNFTLENWREGLVIDIEPDVKCDDSYLGGQFRDCSQFLFTLQQKASETYYGVAGNPYVKGGAGYRFTGLATPTGESISIRSYPNPDYYLDTNEILPVADSVTYKIILRDVKNGGKDLWSREYYVGGKG